MRLVLASNNKKKLCEMSDILSGMGHSVISMAEAGIDIQPEEDGETFEENAMIKAKSAMECCGLPCIADDSGLMVDALGGAPGVYSARYCEGSDLDRVMFLLKNMEGKSDRRARFVSAIACVFPDGRTICARGECPGEILTTLEGEGGFGYDPVFYLQQEGMTFAQMPAEKKNLISHRAVAMREFCEKLKKMQSEEI